MKRSAKQKIDDHTILNEILSLSKQIQLLRKIDVDFVSESEFRVLDALCTNQKSLLNMKQVSEGTNLPPSIVSKAANALEEKGYIGRLHSRQDRRQVNIKITEAGANVLREYHKRRMQRLRPIIENLSDYEREVICEGIGIFQDTISKIRKK
jgi:DNA-binding MarR family transcriptional regulator